VGQLIVKKWGQFGAKRMDQFERIFQLTELLKKEQFIATGNQKQ